MNDQGLHNFNEVGYSGLRLTAPNLLAGGGTGGTDRCDDPAAARGTAGERRRALAGWGHTGGFQGSSDFWALVGDIQASSRV